VLFGSRARGDARPDSDYEVAVFLRDMVGRCPKPHRLADLSIPWAGEAGAHFDRGPHAFLGRAYNLKAIAGHETGPGYQETVPVRLAPAEDIFSHA
jgi:hypothetical protein